MGDEKTYIKKDLDTFFEENPDTPRWPNRQDMIESYLPNADYDVLRVGSYHGTMAIVIKHEDYLWLANDGYGSCSACDYCQADPHGWANDVLASAYCFETLDDLKQYVRNTDDSKYTTIYDALPREEVIELAQEVVESE